MPGFTDIHMHILAGLDDGAANRAESLEMAGAAFSCGTSQVIATPHFDLGAKAFEPEVVTEKVKWLSSEIQASGSALTVLPGFEMRMCTELLDAAKSGEDLSLYTLNRSGKYLLFDLPMGEVPFGTLDACFRLRLLGIRPILAHPERNTELVSRSDSLASLISTGCLIQIDCGSLIGRNGKRARKTSLALLKEMKIHFIASDAHSPRDRVIDLRQAENIAGRLCGEGFARTLLEINPYLVVQGMPLAG